MQKVNEMALAATLAIVYGVMLFAICIVSALTGWARDMMTLYASFFPGISATIPGSLIGAIYGIIFGGVFGYVIGILYNYFDKKVR